MTCEVAIMNRRALVLAADCAGTVTTWVNGRRERRYFKGENKIFQLSESRPIGLMTFGDADFVGVPWELIVKKVSLGTAKSFKDVSGYGDELLSYLRDHTKLFPTTHGEKTFRRKAFAVGIGITSEILNNDRFKQAADDKVKAVEFRALIGEFGIRIDADPLVQPVTADEISHALSKR
jgi:hypothetical protein